MDLYLINIKKGGVNMNVMSQTAEKVIIAQSKRIQELEAEIEELRKKRVPTGWNLIETTKNLPNTLYHRFGGNAI